MEAWGKDQAAGGKVRMLADTTAELTKALGLELDLTAVLGNVRWEAVLGKSSLNSPTCCTAGVRGSP